MLSFQALTNEEIKYICDHIPFSDIRQYFKKNSKEFSDIMPGFRSDRLSESNAKKALQRNINKHFVSSFLESEVNIWLKKIERRCKALTDTGHSKEVALFNSLADSVFCDNCELYFKLTEQEYTDEYISLFREAMLLSQRLSDAEAKIPLEEETTNYKELLEEATSKLSELQEQLNESQAKEETLSKEAIEKDSLISKQEEELKRIKCELVNSETHSANMQSELDYYHKLDNYSDVDFVDDEFSQYQHVSVGQIRHNPSGKPYIIRLADIVNGELIPFVKKDAPTIFENRTTLYWFDGPSEEEYIGVWCWDAIPNETDNTKDYITSSYNSRSKLNRIVELSQCKSINEIADLLIDGIELNLSKEKTLFVCTTTSGILEGLLCNPESLETSGNKVKLLPSVFKLPQFAISPSDIVTLSGRNYYKRMNLGLPQSLYRIRSPYDAVKELVLKRVTISGLHDIGLTKKEAQKSKQFLSNIPTESLIEELSDAYACTTEEANEHVNGFIQHADEYLSENDLDIRVLSLALERNPKLIETCMNQLTDRWETENATKIEEAQKRLDNIEQTANDIEQSIASLNQEKVTLTNELSSINEHIEKAKQLAGNIEVATTQRIEKAQQNVADFVADMAFVSASSHPVSPSTSLIKDDSISVYKSNMPFINGDIIDDIDTFEEELTENITLLGYDEAVAVEMAQAISFSICNKLPVIIGENSTTLAQCIAVTIGGKDLSEIFVSYKSSTIDQINQIISEEEDTLPKVYLIHGVFDGYNINLFNEVSNILIRSTTNVLFLLSLEGINPSMITESIWNKAIFVDGDEGLIGLSDHQITAHSFNMDFIRTIDNVEFKNKRKTLLPYLPLISNTQLRLYSKYLTAYNVELNDSATILNQMITTCRSAGKEDELKVLFHDNGIANGEKMIEKVSE